MFERLGEQFDNLFKKRSHVYAYTELGMDEMEVCISVSFQTYHVDQHENMVFQYFEINMKPRFWGCRQALV